MREILFRGKRTDNGEWINSSETYIRDGDGIWLSDVNLNVVTVVPETVGQYTGLTDKNGVKIFEGDIVSYFKKDILNSEVIYKDGCFMFRFISEFTQRMRQSKQEPIFDNVSMCGEVIGNIHDNPELIETAAKPAAKNIAKSELAPATEYFELMEG